VEGEAASCGVPARVSLLTLGVRDVERSRAFYRRLGWDAIIEAADGFTLFRTAGTWLAVFPETELRRHMGGSAQGQAVHAACSINVETPAAVDAAMAAAERAGARVLAAPSAPMPGFWAGWFEDPDGHAWEVAFNPSWPIGPDGRPQVSGT
jgi:uncharacterized protein